MIKTISKLKKGELFKLFESGEYWVRGEYVRSEKRYSCTKLDDCRCGYKFKGSKVVFINR